MQPYREGRLEVFGPLRQMCSCGVTCYSRFNIESLFQHTAKITPKLQAQNPHLGVQAMWYPLSIMHHYCLRGRDSNLHK